MATDSYKPRREEAYQVSDSRSLFFLIHRISKHLNDFFLKVHFETINLLPMRNEAAFLFLLIFVCFIFFLTTGDCIVNKLPIRSTLNL